MKGWLRLRSAVASVQSLLSPGDYLVEGDIAKRQTGLGTLQLFNPRRIHVMGATEELDQYDTVIWRNNCLILLATGRHKVLRIYFKPDKVERLLTNSRWLGEVFPCPGAAISTVDLPFGHGVEEGFAHGRILRDVDSMHWVPTYRGFLRCCAANARRCEGELDPSDWFEELNRWTLPRPITTAVARWRDELSQVLESVPLLFSHGDAHNGNLLVTDDGEFAVIDVERAEMQPFYFDALSLPRGSAAVNRALRQQYFHGVFDQELAAVWEAAGAEFRPEWRAPYLLAVVMAHAFRPQFADGTPAKRRDKFVRSATKILDDLLGAKS